MKIRGFALFLALCICISGMPVSFTGAEMTGNTELSVTEEIEMSTTKKETSEEIQNQDIIVGVPSAYAMMQVAISEDTIAEQKIKWDIICQADPDYHLDTSYYLDNSYNSSYDKLTQEQFNELQQVAKNLTKDCTSQYEKIEAIVEYVSYNVFYDYAYYYDKSNNEVYINPYEVYVNKRTVCDGYERLVRVLCLSIGIPCMRLLGDNHTYSAIYDSQEKRWIYADATWASRNEICRLEH